MPVFLPFVLATAGCGGGADAPAPPAAVPAAYRSADCATVLGEYGRAIARRDWRVAALAWKAPPGDGAGDGGAGQAARLEREFRDVTRPVMAFEPVMVTDGPATRQCVAGVTLRGTPGAPPRIGTISLARPAGVAGVPVGEARWRIDDMTLSDPMERVDRGDPA